MLTDASIEGKVDRLLGLKENVIIGKLIPAATGLKRYRNDRDRPVREGAEGDLRARGAAGRAPGDRLRRRRRIDLAALGLDFGGQPDPTTTRRSRTSRARPRRCPRSTRRSTASSDGITAREVELTSRAGTLEKGRVKRLLVILLAVCAGFAAAPHRAAADTCGDPGEGDDLGRLRRRLGAVLADLRAAGRDRGRGQLHLSAAAPRARSENRLLRPQLPPAGVGTPLEPYDPGVVINRANRLYSTAAMSSGCTQPVIAENELNGASLVTPWTANNAAYRRNVLIYMQTLSALRRAPGAARLERAVHRRRGRRLVAAALAVRRRRARVVLRRARNRQAGADRAAAGRCGNAVPQARRRVHLRRHPREQARADARLPDDARLGRPRGRSRATSWLEVDEARRRSPRSRSRARSGSRSVWSWGWAAWSTGERDPDKPIAACVYLWARDPSLCNGPAAAGKGFNASLTEGQLDAPGRYPLHALRPADHREHDLRADARHRRPGRRLHAPPSRAPSTSRAGQAQGQAGLRRRARGRRGPLRRQLRRATAPRSPRRTRAPARRAAIIGDELRRAGDRVAASASPARRPRRSTSYYETYGASRARLVSVEDRQRPGSAKRKRGFALESMAPPQLFSLPAGRRLAEHQDDARHLPGAGARFTGLARALPLGVARPAIVNALQGARARRPLRGVAAGARAGARTSRRSAAATPSPRSASSSSLTICRSWLLTSSSGAAAQPRRAGLEDLALAELLGAVERLVGPLEERRRVVVRQQLGDPRREGQPPGLADRPRRDRAAQAVVELVGVGESTTRAGSPRTRRRRRGRRCRPSARRRGRARRPRRARRRRRGGRCGR